MFNIYTNDQLIYDGTRSFIYADDLCITSQYQSFKQVEETIEEALNNLTTYYKMNACVSILKKTQVTALHLRNKEANKSLKVVWNKTELENTAYPKNLGVTLDRPLCYKQNTKVKVATRNNHAISSKQPANFIAKVIRCSEWRKRLRCKPHIGIINLHEEMAKGYDSPLTTWKCLDRLRTGYTCSKTQGKK